MAKHRTAEELAQAAVQALWDKRAKHMAEVEKVDEALQKIGVVLTKTATPEAPKVGDGTRPKPAMAGEAGSVTEGLKIKRGPDGFPIVEGSVEKFEERVRPPVSDEEFQAKVNQILREDSVHDDGYIPDDGMGPGRLE